MNAPTETILKKGYILIPKSMIEDFFKTGSQTEGYLEAWIQVLTGQLLRYGGLCTRQPDRLPAG